MIPVSYNLRSLKARKMTTIATALGIALVVFVFASVMMLSAGIAKTLGSAGRKDTAIILRKGSDAELSSTVTDSQVGQVLAMKEFVARAKDGGGLGVGEVIAVITLDKLGTSGVANVTIRGTSERSYEMRPEVKIVKGAAPRPGTDEVIVGQAIAGRFRGLKLGGSFELKKNRPMKVVGVFSANGSATESEVWGDLDVVRGAFGRDAVVSSARARLLSAEKFDAFETALETDQSLGLEVMRESEYYEKQSEGMSQFITMLGMIIAVFFSIGAMIGAMITMYSSVANRRREIGTLRALGFSRISIMVSFVIESIALATLGGLIGMVASLGMGFLTFSTTNFATFSEVVFRFEPTPGILIGAWIFAAIMGIVGGFFPALRAARTSPLVAMRA